MTECKGARRCPICTNKFKLYRMSTLVVCPHCDYTERATRHDLECSQYDEYFATPKENPQGHHARMAQAVATMAEKMRELILQLADVRGCDRSNCNTRRCPAGDTCRAGPALDALNEYDKLLNTQHEERS